MGTEPYYEGDAVELQFYVREGLKPITPRSADVTVYRGRTEIISNQQAEVEESQVSFLVLGEYTKPKGDYKAIFTVYIAPDQPRTHVMWFRILPKGVVLGKERDAELALGLSEKSSDHEADAAFGSGLRSLRRAGVELIKASKVLGDIISKKTNRKMPMDIYMEDE